MDDKRNFMEHVRDNRIADMIHEEMKMKMGRSVSHSERNSWSVSLQHMRNILDDDEIPSDAGVAIEYNIPQTSKRVDFIISGYDKDEKGNIVIVELKQWDSAELTNMDAIVKVKWFGNVPHPSYQAWSYKQLLEDYNVAVLQERVGLFPCAYLHNYREDQHSPAIASDFYSHYLEKAPAFLMDDNKKLRGFIKKHIKYGDKKELLYVVEAGKIRPSKNLANHLSSMMEGNEEFILIDEQKTAYEIALNLANSTSGKKVLIIKGGPGTGKTVVAINLLAELTQRGKVVQYVTSNAAPRAVYEAKLTGVMHKTRISNMFSGSTVYQNIPEDTFDVLVVDEAHRLSERNIINTYKGNQIRDLINSAQVTIFFLDESQKVLLEDIGSEREIKRIANKFKAEVTVTELASQFRCNGSDGYLAWLDNLLGIRETANTTLEGIDFDFRVIDSPRELHDLIRMKNQQEDVQSGSRVVAGYCWPWSSKKDLTQMDIEIGDYSVQWNKQIHGSLWALIEDSIDEIGCIHTCQGLEFDYIGVIIGEDLIALNGEVITQPEKRNHVDANKTLRGYKGKMKSKDPIVIEETQQAVDEIIRNTYKVLLSRGQKGCYVYCCDKNLEEHIKRSMGSYKEKIHYDEYKDDSYVMAADEREEYC